MNISYNNDSEGFKKLAVLSFLAIALMFFGSLRTCAQSSNQNRLMLSVGALYEKGFDATISYEHETRYYNAWEFWTSYYIKYADDPLAGHITKNSFWHNYNTWHIGICYKPCIARGRNHHGNARIGLSGGSDLDKIIGGGHIGYEHSYALYGGWEFFFQVREDFILRGEDLFRTGVSLGFKIPL